MDANIKRKKVGILGGSFNPITKAHIQIARHVFDNSAIQEIWLMPVYNHLQKSGLESYTHRFNMCKIAAEPFSEFITVSNFEAEHELSGSVFELMEKLRETHKDTEFYYIIGMDQANNFHTWKNWELLKDTTKFIVFPRQGIEEDLLKADWYTKAPHLYSPPLIGYPIMDISSTKIREMLKEIDTDYAKLEKVLDGHVLNYICYEELYEG